MFQGISIHQNQDDRQEDAQNLRQILHQVYFNSLSQHKIIPFIHNSTIHCQFYMKYLKFKTRLKSNLIYIMYIGT